MKACFRSALLVLLVLLVPVQGDPPRWWREGEPPVIDPAAATNPLGPANIGQAKWMAKRALDALAAIDAQLAAGIEQRLTQAQPNPDGGMVPAILDFGIPAAPQDAAWHERQHAPLLLGQLKAIAAPFYDQLHAAAPWWLDCDSSDPAAQGQLQLNGTKDPWDAANFYPWTADPGDDANHAIATIGQLKAVFSLRFDSLAASLPDGDYDHDGLTNAQETAYGTDPRNPDSDGDGMPDAWEIKWGLDPLNPADATADTDGDHVSNLREYQLGTCPTGVWRIEILPLGDNKYFHSAEEDGSVVVQDSLIPNPDSTLEKITAPAANTSRSVIPFTPATWNPPDTILADLLTDGVLIATDSLNPCGPDSADQSLRVYQSAEGYMLLRQPGTYVHPLAADVSWQALNNNGEAVGLKERTVAATNDQPQSLEQDVVIQYAEGSITIPMPGEWFPAASPPSLQAFSDDGIVLIRRPLITQDGTSRVDAYLLNTSTRAFSPVKQPAPGGNAIVCLAVKKSRLLGGGATPFLVTTDGTPLRLSDLQILNIPTSATVPLSSLCANPIVPHHITADGRITASTTNPDGQPSIMQIIPNNDADQDGMDDDWEASQIAYLIAADPQQWGSLASAGTLNPNTQYWNSPDTAVQAFAGGTNPGANLLSKEIDHDQDGVPDIDDADPNDSVVDWKRAAETTYAVIVLEHEDYSMYPYSIEPVASDLLQPVFSASIDDSGMVLWNDIVQTNGSTSWSGRQRVWKTGVWSDLISGNVTYNSFNMSASYVYDEESQITRTVDISVNPHSNHVKFVGGGYAVGYAAYSGSAYGLEYWHLLGWDQNNQAVKEHRNDMTASAGANPVANLWSSQSQQDAIHWQVNPIAPPNLSFYELPISPASFQIGGACAAASPGGAIAVLGGNMTTDERKWKIWTPPSVPGTDTPAWEKLYVDAITGRCLQINAIEDGGSVAGVSWDISSGWWQMNNRRLLVIDSGVTQELPGGTGEAPHVYGLCRVKVGNSGDSRLVAAGTNVWVKKYGRWRVAEHTPTVNPVLAVAKNGVLLGSHSIWRNGAEVSLDTLVANQRDDRPDSVARFTNLRAYAMNSDGAIVALADHAGRKGPGKKTLVVLVPSEICPDYNRDGRIDDKDRGKATVARPWRFWNNDDHDVGDTGGTDVPFDTVSRDCDNSCITSMRDLIDHFPAQLALHDLIRFLPTTKYTYWLSYDTRYVLNDFPDSPGSGPFLKVAWNPEATMEPGRTYMDSGSWQKDADKAFTLVDKSLELVNPSPSTGQTCVKIPPEMLNSARTNDGLIWISAGNADWRCPTPLQVLVKDSSDMVVAVCSLPLSVSGAEDMFRHKNLRGVCEGPGGSSNRDSCPNYPDEICNDKWLIFLHGYNVNGEQARGWQCEAFKRFFWSGSNARFVGVSWYGDETQNRLLNVTPKYYENVENAFTTAEHFAHYINNDLGSGDKFVASHSLGCLVAADAIATYGADIVKAFLYDPAFPTESLLPKTKISNDAAMEPGSWRPYPVDIKSSDWYRLFPNADGRSKLTWRGRFNAAVPKLKILFSPGEEVLTSMPLNIEADPAWATEDPHGKYAFSLQARLKGMYGNEPRDCPGVMSWIAHAWGSVSPASTYGGWGRSVGFENPKYISVDGRFRDPPWFQAFLNGNDRSQFLRRLQVDPPFRVFPSGFLNTFDTSTTPPGCEDLFDPNSGSQVANTPWKARRIMAQMIPERSLPAGGAGGSGVDDQVLSLKRKFFDVTGKQIETFDMQANRNGWPEERTKGIRFGDGWRHSDVREVAYPYVWKAWRIVVEDANLDQNP